jgi:tetratricopeptide (TPR) repeat protein
MLKARLAECASEAERENLLWKLVLVYSQAGRPEAAVPYVQQLLAAHNEPGPRAFLLLSLGQLMEQTGNLAGAVGYYAEGLALQVGAPEVRYLLHNNLGFCLNHLERYAEAEPLCLAAIELDPKRHNAHKNLGVALEGQGRYAEAAQSYVQAARQNPADPRALRHLEAMLAEHPAVTAVLPDLPATLEECRALAGPGRWVQ